jgi:hypothetical protein
MTEINAPTTAATSSIGATWPPVPTNNDRLRGFYADRIIPATQAEVYAFGDELEAVRSVMASEQLGSRLAVKAIMETGAISLLRSFVKVEAAVPLANGHHDLQMVFLGFNLGSRRPAEQEFINGQSTIFNAIYTGRSGNNTNLPNTDGLVVETLRGDTAAPDRIESLTPEFSELFTPFGYDQTNTAAILGDPNNTLVYLRNEETGHIVSSAMAETATVAVGGLGDIAITEITEAITRSEFRGHGYYRLVSRLLVNEMRDQIEDGRPINAIYGEGNIASPGVLVAAAQNGRRFSMEDAAALGVPRNRFGILPQSFAIADGSEPGYRDLAVSYLTDIVK